MLAPLATLYGDVQRLMRIVLRLLFYFSPILYGINDIATRFDRRSLGRLGRRHLRVRQPVRRDLRPLPRWRSSRTSGSGWSAVLFSAVFAVRACCVVGIRVFRRFEGLVLKEI